MSNKVETNVKVNEDWQGVNAYAHLLPSNPNAKQVSASLEQAAKDFYGPNDRLCGNAYAHRM